MNSLSGQSLLQHIADGDVNAVNALLSNGIINLDERDEDGQTFLMVACQLGDVPIVRRLVEEPSIDVNSVDNDNWTALLNASKQGSVEVLKVLLNAGANIEHRDTAGWTALTWTCYKGCSDAARFLLSQGANANVKGEHHMSCLTWAAGRGHAEIVRELLKHDAKVNTADKYGTTPLIWACRKGHADIVDMLLQAGAVVDKAGMNSWTALIVAATGGYGDVVQLLLARHPNVNAVDKDGYTALTLAVKEGFIEITGLLLQQDAYVNLPDRYGDTILIHAVKGNHLEVVRALLKKYADVDVQGVDGKTALYWAVDKGLVSVTKALLEASANIEIATKDGDTPLLRAVRNRNLDLVQLLLDKGAKVSTCDKRGDSALHVAVRGRSKRITDFLLRNPKNSRLLYNKNKAGETPYQIDATHDRSVLTQVYAARNLNADEAVVQGYELYSSTIADVLSEPSLRTPITVGLFARWGSGKSFLINRLRKEMEAFAERKADSYFEFSLLQFFIVLMISVLIGVSLGVAFHWPIGLAVGGGLFLVQYLFLVIVWFGCNRREWVVATRISVYLSHKFEFLSLFLHLIFCNEPEQKQRDTAGIRFLFTDNARMTTLVGDKFIIGMIGTLCDALESEYGLMVPRLYRIFRPLKACDHGRFKSICCIPYFVITLLVLTCAVATLIMMAVFNFHPFNEVSTSPPINYTLVNSIMIALGSIVGLAILANIYTWLRAIIHLATPTRKQVERLARRFDTLKMDGFIMLLKKEVEAIGCMTHCMDAFTNNHTRLVVIVDGLDSCEQDRLLQVLDMVHMLFGGTNDADSPFITILAIDPHNIIRGIEHNLHGHFRESSINGHDYLRTIIQLPLFIQSQAQPRQPALAPPRNYSTTRADILASGETGGSSGPPTSLSAGYHHQESCLSGASYLSLTDIGKSNSRAEGKGAAGSKRLKQNNAASTANFGSTTLLVRQPSHFDLSKSLGKSSYFSDINPRSMKRLMNILAVTGRLLRAYNIDFNWYKLASWVNITEQWPYRLSWIILEVEDHTDIEDTQPLKAVYDRVSPKIPSSRDVDPLVDIDRNVRKLEVFLANSSPPLTVADLRRFLSCTINVDPYLRKLIRELQQNTEAMTPDYGIYNNSFDQTGGPWPQTVGQSRPSMNGPATLAPGMMRRSQQLQVPLPGSPRLSQVRGGFFGGPQPPAAAAFYSPNQQMMVHPMMLPMYMQQMYDAQQQQQQHDRLPATAGSRGPAAPPTNAATSTAAQPPSVVSAPEVVKSLSAMTVDDVTDLLGRIDGLSRRMLPDYSQRLVENNITGAVLLSCDLNELKPVLQMAFGDWVLFRSLVETLRYQEMTGNVVYDGIPQPASVSLIRLTPVPSATAFENSDRQTLSTTKPAVPASSGSTIVSSKKAASDVMAAASKTTSCSATDAAVSSVSSPNLKLKLAAAPLPALLPQQNLGRIDTIDASGELQSPSGRRKVLNRQDSFVSEVMMESEALRGFIQASVAGSDDSDRDSPVDDGDVQRGISPIPEEEGPMVASRNVSFVSLGAAARQAAVSRQTSVESAELATPGDRAFYVGPDNDSGESDSEEVERLSRKSSMVVRRKGGLPPAKSPQPKTDTVVKPASENNSSSVRETSSVSVEKYRKSSISSKATPDHGSRRSSLRSESLQTDKPSAPKSALKATTADRQSECTMPLMSAYFPMACDRGPERGIQGTPGTVFISPAEASPKLSRYPESSVPSSAASSYRDSIFPETIRGSSLPIGSASSGGHAAVQAALAAALEPPPQLDIEERPRFLDARLQPISVSQDSVRFFIEDDTSSPGSPANAGDVVVEMDSFQTSSDVTFSDAQDSDKNPLFL